MDDTQNSTYIIAGSVIVAGAIIALGVVFAGPGNTTPTENNNTANHQNAMANNTQQNQQQNGQQQAQLDNINPVTEEDHVRGSLDAPVKIVEYSDFECPFCQRFHSTMNSIRSQYSGDEVAWVMRHFPVPQLHSKAPRAAKASECAANLSEEDNAFWKFADSYYQQTPSNNRVNLDSLLPSLNQELGVDQAAFEECMASSQFEEGIQQDVQNARDTGGRGTPWTVVIGPDGEKFPINGAQPESAVTAIIDSALDQ
jgi:protein-disulfide isomerase